MEENDLKGLANSLIQQVNGETQQLNQKHGFTQDDRIQPINAGDVLSSPASQPQMQQPAGQPQMPPQQPSNDPFSDNAPLELPDGMALPSEYGGGQVMGNQQPVYNPQPQQPRFSGAVAIPPQNVAIQPDLHNVLVRNLLAIEKNMAKQTELVKDMQNTIDTLVKKIEKMDGNGSVKSDTKKD